MSKGKSMDASKRIEMQFSVLRTAAAILISLVIAFILIATVSDNPGGDFVTLLTGPAAELQQDDDDRVEVYPAALHRYSHLPGELGRPDQYRC